MAPPELQPVPGIPVHPDQSGPNQARQLLEIAQRQGWLTWETTTLPIRDPHTGERTYYVRVGDLVCKLATVDEVKGFVFAAAAAHGKRAVDLIRYRTGMTEGK